MKCDLCSKELDSMAHCSICDTKFCPDCGDYDRNLCKDCIEFEDASEDISDLNE